MKFGCGTILLAGLVCLFLGFESIITIVVIAIIILIYGLIRSHRNEKENESLVAFYDSIKDFTPDKTIVGFDCHFIFGVDSSRQQYLFLDRDRNIRRFSFRDVIACDIVEGDGTITQNSYTAGGMVGGFIGGITHHGKPKEKVSSIAIGIMTANIHNPRTYIVCFDAKAQYNMRFISLNGVLGEQYAEAYVLAQEVVDVINIITGKVNNGEAVKIIPQEKEYDTPATNAPDINTALETEEQQNKNYNWGLWGCIIAVILIIALLA